ncbi:MAG TPA: glycosyltransferase 87 family protein [Streptosporangiaceae bacterium]
MTYRARHVRAVPPVSSQVRCRKFRVGRAGLVRRADHEAAAKQAHEASADLTEERGNGPQSGTATDSRLSRLDRVGTPLLVIGAIAWVLAFERFVMRVADPSYAHRMFDLGMFRDGGLIIRHAYHVHSGQPAALYDLVVRHGANPFSYPPFAAAIFAVMSFVSPLALEWGITVLSVGALTYAVWLTLAGMGVPRGRARTGAMLAASAAALWTQPVQSNLSLGQINLLLMAAIIWDLRPSRAELDGIRLGADGPIVGSAFSTVASPWWTGLATGVAAGIKLTPLIFIPYLLITRRFRQAGVAAAAFAVTVGIGFAVVPGASATYWRSGLLDRATGAQSANTEFFFGSTWNQSLRGYLSRLLQDSQIAVAPWLIAAALTLVIGLVCATWLYRDGYPMLGLLTCAVTGLLISPVSWVHQWVWIGPWLAALGGLALLARGASRRMWLAVTGLLILAFGNFPVTAGLTGGRHGMNVITDVPMNQPAIWHGHQVIAGNIYFLCGAAGLIALFGWGIVRAFRQAPAALIAQPLQLPANVELVPEAMTLRE